MLRLEQESAALDARRAYAFERMKRLKSTLRTVSARSVALAATIGPTFFLLAKLGIGLPWQSGYVDVFWPAMGFGVGILIGLGPSVRLPVLASIAVANFLANLSSGDPPQIAAAKCLSEATECLTPVWLIERWFGPHLSLDRFRHVLGLLAAGSAGSAAGAICWIATSRLFYGATEPILATFGHWFLSDMVGFITLAPFVIKLFAIAKRPPSQRETIEGIVALLALATMTGIIILLPPRLWDTAFPIAWLFPMLLWLAARCRPAFSAAGAFLVSITIVSTTVVGVGHFGDPKLAIGDRILEAQTTIIFVTLCALVLAVLFAERRESEAGLGRSKMMLERERDNKLMNVRAIIASIAHEIRQPLTVIAVDADAALLLSKQGLSTDHGIREVLVEIKAAALRTSDVLDSLRTLFGKIDQERRAVDLNSIVRDVLRSLQSELTDRRIDFRDELTVNMPNVYGNRGQLQEVLFNLVNNSIEAMDSTQNGPRILCVKTALRSDQTIAVSIQDSGPGIDPKAIDSIFGPFITTKAKGGGLGLAICRMIIDEHGGQLTATSDGKNGALFQFVLPTGKEWVEVALAK
jgi:signal transduction histidine kinase